MIAGVCLLALISLSGTGCQQNPEQPESVDDGIEFRIVLDESVSSEPEDGRLLLMLATHGEKEPRFLVHRSP